MKKRKVIIVIVIAIFAVVVFISYEILNEVRIQREAAKSINEYCERNSQPWMHWEFDSEKDYDYYSQRIGLMNISDEEKTKARGELWHRFYEWRQSHKDEADIELPTSH